MNFACLADEFVMDSSLTPMVVSPARRGLDQPEGTLPNENRCARMFANVRSAGTVLTPDTNARARSSSPSTSPRAHLECRSPPRSSPRRTTSTSGLWRPKWVTSRTGKSRCGYGRGLRWSRPQQTCRERVAARRAGADVSTQITGLGCPADQRDLAGFPGSSGPGQGHRGGRSGPTPGCH